MVNKGWGRQANERLSSSAECLSPESFDVIGPMHDTLIPDSEIRPRKGPESRREIAEWPVRSFRIKGRATV